MKTWLAILTTFLCAMVARGSQAFNGHIIFFQDPWVSGPHFEMTFGALRRCYNIDKCFNDAASSVIWAGIPEHSSFLISFVFTSIVFFTDVNCQGRSKEWLVRDYDFPMDFGLDGLDNQISSFVIKTYDWDEYYNVQCGSRRRKLQQEEGVWSNGSRSDGNIVADCSDDEDGVYYLNETSSAVVDHASDLEGDAELSLNATTSSDHYKGSHSVKPLIMG